MIGGLLALLSAVTFAYANATVRRGVLTGTVLQAVAISLPIGLPFFLLAMMPTGGFAALAAFDTRAVLLLVVAGVIHFALARYCNYRATKAMGANLVAPIQQYSLVITLVLAVVWLGEAVTVMRVLGIICVVAGPALTLGPRKKAATPSPAGNVFEPAYGEGYLFALLSAVGFGISPILVGMAFAHQGLAAGIAGGFISYLAATVAIMLPLLLPGQWKSFRAVDGMTARWFVISGIAVAISQMARYMALAVAPVSVVSPIQRLSMVFRIYFGAILNPQHEVFGGRIIAGTVISLLGAVALSVSVDGLAKIRYLENDPRVSIVAEGGEPLLGDVAEEGSGRALLPVVVVGRLLEVGQDLRAGVVVRVRELDHVIALPGDRRLIVLRFDDDGAVGAFLLLQAGMAVIPVGAALHDGEAVGEGLARRNARIADARHAVLPERQDQAVPVNRAGHRQTVGHVDDDVFAFLEAKHRARRLAVVGDRLLRRAVVIDRDLLDHEVVGFGRRRCGGGETGGDQGRQQRISHRDFSRHRISIGPFMPAS